MKFSCISYTGSMCRLLYFSSGITGQRGLKAYFDFFWVLLFLASLFFTLLSQEPTTSINKNLVHIHFAVCQHSSLLN